MADIQYLRLNNNWDISFSAESALTDIDAVAQAINTRLLLFQGEWWENLNLGVPMFQSILGASGAVSNQNRIKVILTEQIAAVPFVIAVLDAAVTFDPVSRRIIYVCSVDTTFGPVTVTNNPGSAASIGGNT